MSRTMQAFCSVALVAMIVAPAMAWTPLITYNFDGGTYVGTDGAKRYTENITSDDYDGKWYVAGSLGGNESTAFTSDNPFTDTANDYAGNQSALLLGGPDNNDQYHVMKPQGLETLNLRGEDTDPDYNKLTLEAWVKVTDWYDGRDQTFVNVAGMGPSGTHYTNLGIDAGTGGELQARTYFNGTGANMPADTTTGTAVPLNVWTHVAMTYSAPDGVVKAYINGTEVWSDTEYISPSFPFDVLPYDMDLPLMGELSSNDTQIGRTWSGQVDDVRISRGIVPVSEMGYNSPFQGEPALEWDLNGDGVEDSQDIDYQLANPADLNGDGSVNLDDTLYLVGTGFGTLMGDTNLDGAVDEADLAWVADGWKIAGTYAWATGDFTGNDFIDEEDLAFLADNWKQPAPTAAAVPEPMTLSLLGLGGLALVRRRG